MTIRLWLYINVISTTRKSFIFYHLQTETLVLLIYSHNWLSLTKQLLWYPIHVDMCRPQILLWRIQQSNTTRHEEYIIETWNYLKHLLPPISVICWYNWLDRPAGNWERCALERFRSLCCQCFIRIFTQCKWNEKSQKGILWLFAVDWKYANAIDKYIFTNIVFLYRQHRNQ